MSSLFKTKLVLLSAIIVCLHPSMSLNNEHNCREIREDKMSVCKKTARVYGAGSFRI